MDQNRFTQTELLIRHQHNDGSWGEMAEDRSHHDASDHDAERSWGLRRIFRCAACSETVTVIPGAEGDVAGEAGS